MKLDFSYMEPIRGWKEVVAHYMNVDGYMATYCSSDVPLGTILRFPEIDMPLCVVGYATREDALRQWEIAKRITGECPIEPPEGGYWYKVTTD